MSAQETISIYVQLGGAEGVRRLVDAYVSALERREDAQELRALYAASGASMPHYAERLWEFLCGWLGGPAVYQSRHGMPMLRENHRRICIRPQDADAWMRCMREALELCVANEALRMRLDRAFSGMAASLQSGSSFSAGVDSAKR